MSQIDFKRGEFQTFRATTTVHLGKLGKDLQEGDVIEFDGQTVRMGGETHQVSTLKAAIKVDWLVPIADTTTNYRPKPSGIRVRPAQDASQKPDERIDLETVNDEERVVGELGTANLGQREGKTVTEPVNIATAEELPVEISGSSGPVVSDGAAEVSGEGSVVAKISSATSQKVVLDDSSAAAREIRRLDNPQGVSKLPVEHVEHVREARKAAATRSAATATEPQIKIIIWGGSMSPKKRLARAIREFGENKEALTQIYKIEDNFVRDGIKKYWILKSQGKFRK
jgi:hypothetical protein